MDDVGLVKAPRICKMGREDSGYGFNLHGEKGVVGQYISGVDPGGSADRSGLCVGDRVVEVNGINVEAMSHAEVVTQIRSDLTQASLLVVDKITDNYLKKINRPVTSSLASYSSVHEIKISNTDQLAALRNSRSTDKGDEDVPTETNQDNNLEVEDGSAIKSMVPSIEYETAQDENTSTQEEITSTQEEITSTQEEITSTQEEITSTPDENISNHDENNAITHEENTPEHETPPFLDEEVPEQPQSPKTNYYPSSPAEDTGEYLPPHYGEVVNSNRVERHSIVKNGEDGTHYTSETTIDEIEPAIHRQDRPVSDIPDQQPSEWTAVKRNSVPSPKTQPDPLTTKERKQTASFKTTPKRKEVKQTSTDWKAKLDMFDNL